MDCRLWALSLWGWGFWRSFPETKSVLRKGRMKQRLVGFVGGLRARMRRLGLFLAVALVTSASFAQESTSAFSDFQAKATTLIGQWEAVALLLCGAWVVAKLGPKFIKRLTGAV